MRKSIKNLPYVPNILNTVQKADWQTMSLWPKMKARYISLTKTRTNKVSAYGRLGRLIHFWCTQNYVFYPLIKDHSSFFDCRLLRNLQMKYFFLIQSAPMVARIPSWAATSFEAEGQLPFYLCGFKPNRWTISFSFLEPFSGNSDATGAL